MVWNPGHCHSVLTDFRSKHTRLKRTPVSITQCKTCGNTCFLGPLNSLGTFFEWEYPLELLLTPRAFVLLTVSLDSFGSSRLPLESVLVNVFPLILFHGTVCLWDFLRTLSSANCFKGVSTFWKIGSDFIWILSVFETARYALVH